MSAKCDCGLSRFKQGVVCEFDIVTLVNDSYIVFTSFGMHGYLFSGVFQFDILYLMWFL